MIKYTSPLKLFDYIAAGKLVISSNLSVIKEILTHNKNSILIKISQIQFLGLMKLKNKFKL